MKKLLLFALLVVGCNNSPTENIDEVVGSYILSHQIQFPTSDCIGEGTYFSVFGNMIYTVSLNSDGSMLVTYHDNSTTEGIWNQSDNLITTTINDASSIFIYSDNTLIIQVVSVSNCLQTIFIKI